MKSNNFEGVNSSYVSYEISSWRKITNNWSWQFDSSHNFDVYRFLTLNLVPKVCLFLVLILDFHEHTTMMNHRPWWKQVSKLCVQLLYFCTMYSPLLIFTELHRQCSATTIMWWAPYNYNTSVQPWQPWQATNSTTRQATKQYQLTKASTSKFK